MNLPTQAQVNTATRYIGTVAGTAFAIFGLQAKGFSLDQMNGVIASLGAVANDIFILVATIAPIYATIRGVSSSSPTGQAAALGANKKTIVNPTSGGGAIINVTDTAMAVAALDAQRKAS